MDPRTTKLLAWLDARRDDMLDLLREVVNIDSGSYDKAGVDRVGERLLAFLADHGVPCHRTPLEAVGDILRFGPEASQGSGRSTVLLMGHRDTVFGEGEALRRPFHVEGARAHGPGVADMKGGLVMNAFVMAAFAAVVPDVPLVFLTTGDEEIGSEASRPHIEAEAVRAMAVFNAEPGRASGNVVNGRKGGLTYHFDITGKAAHAGVNFSDGASAIGELAWKVVSLDALTRVDEGMTLTVGLVNGGTSVNTVAARAHGELDARFVNRHQREHLIAEIERVLSVSIIPGTRTSYRRRSESLPLAPSPENDALTSRYIATARDLGLDISAEFTGGCADSGITSWAGAPTVCAIGPVGGRVHTEREYIETPTLLQRAQVLAATIASLG
ncbi:MAG: M20 family metallopeptidase [Rhodospirillum sp.]|nr:M20 family metallopeptidase [Rhodospirillum sp.]MCF8488593.1 M20 family metallopeptidase [Rhodospirillum sp.]MCF8499703.1 M20 family metallopeptidase [Rhodospirillum sp.]